MSSIEIKYTISHSRIKKKKNWLELISAKDEFHWNRTSEKRILFKKKKIWLELISAKDEFHWN